MKQLQERRPNCCKWYSASQQKERSCFHDMPWFWNF